MSRLEAGIYKNEVLWKFLRVLAIKEGQCIQCGAPRAVYSSKYRSPDGEICIEKFIDAPDYCPH